MKARRLPPLPEEIHLPAGPVKVVRSTQEELATAQEEETPDRVLGLALEGERVIMVLDTLPSERAWNILYHELWHVILYDAGLATEYDERLCDIYANAQMFDRMYAPRKARKKP